MTREMLRLAIARLGTSRLRAALTVLGITIGVASVVALVSIVEGATSNITTQLQGLGTNLISVNPGRLTFGATRGALGSVTTLTIEDAEAIAGLDGVAAVAPELGSQQLVVAGDRNETTSVVGTTASFNHGPELARLERGVPERPRDRAGAADRGPWGRDGRRARARPA